ncbi:hypothetical protein AM501_12945 [Aneurinibacillus migulanus]|uniref:hypothetical protein n=1 Tax=Aneurinibacillus migulanus TaxID=47500 RepID=UPI0005BC1A7C|nr:hypothetical protein [Aneurinibacillus migulanus]KIV53971.1 hypothetical protein TS64_16755 [Aneurinibacillus migulanus]KPD07887.1 hypothetical protein AM501_12945 [Aneurinibacillus migulanus]
MTPQQTESLHKESEELKQGVDQALSQRTPEQKQRDLDALLEAAQRVHKRVWQAKGGESV